MNYSDYRQWSTRQHVIDPANLHATDINQGSAGTAEVVADASGYVQVPVGIVGTVDTDDTEITLVDGAASPVVLCRLKAKAGGGVAINLTGICPPSTADKGLDLISSGGAFEGTVYYQTIVDDR